MTETREKPGSVIIGLSLIGLILWAIYGIVSTAWEALLSVDTKLAVSLLTAATTVIVSTTTVVIGKYLERQKEIESHFREKKIQIYDEFLKGLFEEFYSREDSKRNVNDEPPESREELVSFLQEWQRRLILWGGSEVLVKYIEWKNYMTSHEPDAQAIFLMGKLFKAIRKDVGLTNHKLEDGTFSNLILQNPQLFLKAAQSNPNITLAQLAEMEKSVQNNL